MSLIRSFSRLKMFQKKDQRRTGGRRDLDDAPVPARPPHQSASPPSALARRSSSRLTRKTWISPAPAVPSIPLVNDGGSSRFRLPPKTTSGPALPVAAPRYPTRMVMIWSEYRPTAKTALRPCACRCVQFSRKIWVD